MSSITVRNLDEGVKQALRIRASENGRSMEQEVRELLKAVLLKGKKVDTNAEAPNFAQRVQQRFQGLNAQDLPLPERQAARDNELF